jgi:hypothetical protein
MTFRYLNESQFPIERIIEFFNSIKFQKMKVCDKSVNIKASGYLTNITAFDHLLKGIYERDKFPVRSKFDDNADVLSITTNEKDEVPVYVKYEQEYEGFKFEVSKIEYSYKEFITKFKDYYVRFDRKYILYSPDDLMSSEITHFLDHNNLEFNETFRGYNNFRKMMFSRDGNDIFYFDKDDYCHDIKNKEVYLFLHQDISKIYKDCNEKDGEYENIPSYALYSYYKEFFNKDFIKNRLKYIENKMIEEKKRKMFLLDVETNDHFQYDESKDKYFWNYFSREFAEKIQDDDLSFKLFEIKDEETALKTKELNELMNGIVERIDKIKSILNKQ